MISCRIERGEWVLEREAASGIMLILLLASVLTLGFGIQQAESEDASLLWNYTTGHGVRVVFASPNNEYVIVGSDDRNVYSLDLATGQMIWSYYTGEWSERVALSIYSVFISPDNKYAIAGTASNTYCFDLSSGEKLWNRTTGETWSVFVSPDSEYVVAGSHNGNIYKFNITNGMEIWKYSTGYPVYRVFISPDGRHILAGLIQSYEILNEVVSLDMNGNWLWNYDTNGDVDSLFISPDSRYVIAGSGGNVADPEERRGRVYCLDIASGWQIWNYTATGPLGASNIPITSVFVSSDSRFVVAGTGNGITPCLDITDGHLMWDYDTGSHMWDVAISANGEYVVTASVGSYPPFPHVSPNVFLLKTADGSKTWNYSTPATSISISPDSTRITVGSMDHSVYAFEAPSPTPPVVTAIVYFDPGTLNLRSNGQWITAYIQLPKDYSPADIVASTVLLYDTISPVLDSKYGFVKKTNGYLVDRNGDGVLERMLKFDRASVASLICQGGGMRREVLITVTGELADGSMFEGIVTVFAFGRDSRSSSKR
jgi:outer membrane protein assembly factor BamB